MSLLERRILSQVLIIITNILKTSFTSSNKRYLNQTVWLHVKQCVKYAAASKFAKNIANSSGEIDLIMIKD